MWTGSVLGKLVLGAAIVFLCFLSGVLVSLQGRLKEVGQTETKLVTQSGATATNSSITLATLNNLSYRIDDRIYQLQEGKKEAASSRKEGKEEGDDNDEPLKDIYLDGHILGDLRGNGSTDAIVILLARTGGTGSYYYLAPVLNDKGNIKVTSNAFFIGDRVNIKKLNLQDGIVTLKLVMHGPDDGGCCPTLERTLKFVLKENALQCTTNPCSEY